MEGKYIVAAVGIGGAAGVGIASLVMKGPDTAVTLAIVSAITFIVGLCFGVAVKR